MKKILQVMLIITLSMQLQCDKTSSDDDSPPTTEDKIYYAGLTAFWFTINSVDYPDQNVVSGATRGMSYYEVGIQIPYMYPLTNLIANFEISEGATAYVNDIEQVSGVTVNDFTNPVQYQIVSYDKKYENTFTITVTWLPNTESKLYWLKVTAESVVYDCVIDQDAKTVTLNVPTGTDLNPVTVEFKISDNARFNEGDSYTLINGGTANFEYSDNITLTVEAADERYETDYTLIKTFY